MARNERLVSALFRRSDESSSLLERSLHFSKSECKVCAITSRWSKWFQAEILHEVIGAFSKMLLLKFSEFQIEIFSKREFIEFKFSPGGTSRHNRWIALCGFSRLDHGPIVVVDAHGSQSSSSSTSPELNEVSRVLRIWFLFHFCYWDPFAKNLTE